MQLAAVGGKDVGREPRGVVLPDDGHGAGRDPAHEWRVVGNDICPELDCVASFQPGLHHCRQVGDVDLAQAVSRHLFT